MAISSAPMKAPVPSADIRMPIGKAVSPNSASPITGTIAAKGKTHRFMITVIASVPTMARSARTKRSPSRTVWMTFQFGTRAAVEV